ncbi:MAG: hypothetical protein K5773_02350 [Pseudobutyrivibrio sp.]|nr:hypothetical protein [Pseudobutyrivibrio sp.]
MYKSSKKWWLISLAIALIICLGIGTMVAVIDPYFHYHKPLENMYYKLDNERSQNDGIIKNFDYDAIVTGTSMAQNFKTSQVDEIFDSKSIKVTFAGASYSEIGDNIAKALKVNPKVKFVIRPLDYAYLMDDVAETGDAAGTYPTYLYDRNPFNDVNYLFNKEIAFEICLPMIRDMINGKKAGITSFDDYSNWMSDAQFGPDAVLADRTEFAAPSINQPYVKELQDSTKRNVRDNVIAVAKANPDVDFYYYFTPYSIAWWGHVYEDGTLNRRIDAEKDAIEMMLECDNIHLFSFNTEYDLITDLDNYKDECHHGDWVNTDILGMIYSGTNQLTQENYKDYLNQERDFYNSYDYNSLFE